MLFIHQGSPRSGRRFFNRFWPEARAVSDKTADLYSEFGLVRGGTKEMFGLPVWKHALRAIRKGAFVGKPTHDPWLMPGAFIVEGGVVVWEHDYDNIGDHPDLPSLTNFVTA